MVSTFTPNPLGEKKIQFDDICSTGWSKKLLDKKNGVTLT